MGSRTAIATANNVMAWMISCKEAFEMIKGQEAVLEENKLDLEKFEYESIIYFYF